MTTEQAARNDTVFARLTARLRTAYDEIVGQDTVDLVLRLTVLVHILFPYSPWYGRIVMVSLGVWAMIHRSLMRNPWFWLFLGCYRLAFIVLLDWSEANNSSYLISYWCIALCCSLLLADPNKAIALNARLLVALVFFFAAVWKATSGEYLDGSMFHYLLYADERFSGAVRLFGSVYERVSLDNQRAAHQMLSLQPVVTLQGEPLLYWLAQLFTWWTLAIEAVIAVLFFWRDGRLIAKWRNLLLLAFIVATYPLTELILFSWLISILGFAQTPPEFRKIRFCYLVALPVTFMFTLGDLEQFLFRLLG